jgi:SAM-dependent methyltransferase
MERHPSILHGKDCRAIEILMEVHCENLDSPFILDCTSNVGTMWKSCGHKPSVKSDIVPSHPIDVCSDFMAMPFRSSIFDVVVFDPPHLPTHAASANSSGMWKERYGITESGEGREGDDVSGMFEPALMEIRRVLKDGGICLAKIADQVHNHRFQWQMCDLVMAARKIGLTPCDLLIKMDPAQGNLKSSKWRSVRHLRKAHSYWVVLRNSRRCERRRA